MAQTPPNHVLEFDVGGKGDRIRITSPEELRAWNHKEWQAWEWIHNGSGGAMQQPYNQHRGFRDRINQLADEWERARGRDDGARIPILVDSVRATLDQHYTHGELLSSKGPEGVFVAELRKRRGEAVAAGACAAILGCELQEGQPWQADFFAGMIEGFLYRREIDWTATAHQEVLDRLKKQYAGNIAHEDMRLKEIEGRNAALNDGFETILKERDQALSKLHCDHTAEFTKLQTDREAEFKRLTDEHIRKLADIETIYNQKLALSKPVEYWQTKEKHHSGLCKIFGWVSLAVLMVAMGAMAWLVHWAFADLQPGQDPKHWQIGSMVVGAFFSIWIVRVMLRLFFSNLHLATDAAERRTMILTYLSMAREGAEFAPEDKTLIVQHLFRSASDGLVKDDAAPPGMFELLTRR